MLPNMEGQSYRGKTDDVSDGAGQRICDPLVTLS